MLSGINRVCEVCSGRCKQWQEATVLSCPSFKRLGLSTKSKTKKCKSSKDNKLHNKTSIYASYVGSKTYND